PRPRLLFGGPPPGIDRASLLPAAAAAVHPFPMTRVPHGTPVPDDESPLSRNQAPRPEIKMTPGPAGSKGLAAARRAIKNGGCVTCLLASRRRPATLAPLRISVKASDPLGARLNYPAAFRWRASRAHHVKDDQ